MLAFSCNWPELAFRVVNTRACPSESTQGWDSCLLRCGRRPPRFRTNNTGEAHSDWYDRITPSRHAFDLYRDELSLVMASAVLVFPYRSCLRLEGDSVFCTLYSAEFAGPHRLVSSYHARYRDSRCGGSTSGDESDGLTVLAVAGRNGLGADRIGLGEAVSMPGTSVKKLTGVGTVYRVAPTACATTWEG